MRDGTKHAGHGTPALRGGSALRPTRAEARRAALALLLAGAGGCGLLGRGNRESPSAVAARAAADARIRAEVESRIAGETSLAAARIRVEVAGGEVGLFGSVPGMGALRCAETNAELVDGVRLVIDHLELAPGPVQVRCLAPRAVRAPSSARALPAA